MRTFEVIIMGKFRIQSKAMPTHEEVSHKITAGQIYWKEHHIGHIVDVTLPKHKEKEK